MELTATIRPMKPIENLNFNEFMENFAAEVGGQYSEYDDNRSVIVIPIEGNRFQSVFGIKKYSERYQKVGLEFASKVCPFTDDIDLGELLKENARFCYAKFILEDGFIKVESNLFLDHINEALVKELIIEVANVADEWEYRLTGQDVH